MPISLLKHDLFPHYLQSQNQVRCWELYHGLPGVNLLCCQNLMQRWSSMLHNCSSQCYALMTALLFIYTQRQMWEGMLVNTNVYKFLLCTEKLWYRVICQMHKQILVSEFKYAVKKKSCLNYISRTVNICGGEQQPKFM